jgi:hypothetical protein
MLLIAACWSFPLFADISGGQDVTFLLLILAVFRRLGPARPFIAGAVLGLAALKFHLFPLVPVFVIAQRRWRILAGAGATVGLILVVCFAVAGPHWMPDYARFILQGRANPSVRVMPNLHGLLDGLPHSLAWEAFGSIAIAFAVWRVALRTSFSVGLGAALVGGLLTSHHAYAADALLLLPALLTLATDLPSVPIRLLSFLLLSPLPFLVTPKAPLSAPVPILLAVLVIVLTVRVSAGQYGGRLGIRTPDPLGSEDYLPIC